MSIVRVLTAGTVLAIVMVQNSPEGEAATRKARALVDDAVEHVDPARLLDDASVRKAAQLLERLNAVTREGIARGIKHYSGGPPPDTDATT